MTTMMSVVREASHAGETERFVRAVGTERRRLAGLAYVLCGDRAVAEDLVAEAFARVWPKWRAGHVDDLPAYLRRALVNLVQGRYRSTGAPSTGATDSASSPASSCEASCGRRCYACP